MKALIIAGIICILSAHGITTHAQELVLDAQETVKARVIEVLEAKTRVVPGTDTKTDFQTLRAEMLDGTKAGAIVTIDNDFLTLEEGDTFYLLHTTHAIDGREFYSVLEPYRTPWLAVFVTLFILCVLIFGGWQGARGLISLGASLLFIFYLLLPGMLAGYSPILVSLMVASLIIILGSYITHGFNKTTTAAVFGMLITILITGVLAYVAVNVTKLTGFASEEAVYLNFNTRGALDFSGLLLGGILIGLLGVLYDAAISQAISVEELHRVGPHLPRHFIFKRAMRIGREHIGALVDTLAIAYVGAALPLLLLFYASDTPILLTLNREIFAVEIVRTMIGGIGLMLTVPITTLVAAWMLTPKTVATDLTNIQKEREAVEHVEHRH